MDTLEASFSMLANPGVLIYLLKGIAFTLVLSVVAVVLGVVFGSVLALVRNYCTTKKTKVFKAMATMYIEVFRNTPLLLWIFICLVFLPFPNFYQGKCLG